MARVGTSSRTHGLVLAALSLVTLALPFVMVTAMVGCGGSEAENQIAAANDSNLRRIGNLYKAYQLRHGNMGPENEQAFRDFMNQDLTPVRLERMQIDPNNIDGLFISEEDGQPLVIRYGVAGGLGTSEAVVFEQSGSGGQRQVGFSDGSVEAVDNARYDQLLSGGQ